MAKAQRIGEVKGLGEVYQLAAPLPEQLEAFNEIGAAYVTPDEVALIRLAGLSDDYSRTSMTSIALKGEPTVLTRVPLLFNPIMARQAVTENASGRYVKLPSWVYEIARDEAKAQETIEPEDRKAIILPGDQDFTITPDRNESKFILRKANKEYFERKRNNKPIQVYNLASDSTKEATVDYTWFSRPQVDSNLSLRYGDLNSHNRAFAVLRKTAEGGSQSSEYNLTEVRNANLRGKTRFLEQRSIVGLAGILEELETVQLDELRASK